MLRYAYEHVTRRTAGVDRSSSILTQKDAAIRLLHFFETLSYRYDNDSSRWFLAGLPRKSSFVNRSRI